ncbi:adhesion G protein-coupled receptor L2-like isoform X2 [Amphibalanus amphitrite]|nr:adhesion G protein-coupled receptor L2-like isoform X2 [Amphibalanus amphitrite]
MAIKATYDDKYPVTTNYYWANIDVNMTSTQGDDTWTTGQGPAGFENSLILQQGCMSHQKWANRREACAHNPNNCTNGFSFSIWARIEMEAIETLFNGTVSTHRRYILSTGGDDQGSPGVAIYVEGHSLHALVSTGAEYWDVSVVGQVISQEWINIGVRWSKTEPFEVPGSTKTLPGLQLYVNSVPLARVAVPAPAQAAVKAILDPVEVMVGCHRTKDNLAYRDFCKGEFDELAMWTRLLPANESIYFLGGYDEQDKETTMNSLLDEFQRCPKCRTDAKMFRAAIDRVEKAIKTPPPTTAPVGSTADSGGAETATAEEAAAPADLPEGTPLASPEEVSKVRTLVDLVKMMTSEAKDPVTTEELPLFLSLKQVVGTALDKETLPQWRNIEYTYKEEGGAASVVTGFEDWALELGSNTELKSLKDNLVHHEKANNIEMVLQRTANFQIRQKPVLNYPIGKTGLNSVRLASELFHNPDIDACKFVGVTVVYVFYPTLGHVSPQRYSKLDINAADTDLELEGGVVSTKYALSSDNPELVANCSPTAEQLRKYPLQTSISHTNPVKAKRGILFHEGEIDTGILRRACVWWNPDLSDYGGWDTDGCKAVEYSDFHTRCACAHFGQMAIMVQKEPPKIVDLEFLWLKIIKYICYTISALLLIIFIVVVIKIKALHEMFHLMRLNTAIGLLFGSVLMVLTDIPEIRADRHTCTGFAGGIHFFYLLAAAMVTMEGIADFISVTSGAIGGKLKSYVAFSWGIPFLSLGYAMLMHLIDYGTDPRCMLGWPDQVKMTMFLPMIVLLVFTFVMTCLVSCNMQASRLRKENIVAEQLTVCKGYVFFSFYFFCTWIVGLIAYLRLGLSIPSFYPLFQILNSTGGIIFFLFCGIGSERFRLLISGKSDLRKKMLLSYTVSEQLSESQQNLVEKEPSRPATPEDDEEFDPEAMGPRGPIVA